MRVRVLLVVVLVVLCTACSGHAGPEHAAPSATVRPTSTPTPTETGPAEPEDACQGGVPFYAKSPPYAGRGPHRMIGFQLQDSKLEETILPNEPPGLPDSWASARGIVTDVFELAPDAEDYARAQLALCLGPPRVTNKVVGTCSYGPEDFPNVGAVTRLKLVSARYPVKLFEARTGRLLTSFEVGGASVDYCPTGIDLRDNRHIAQSADPEALKAKLGPFVHRHA